MTILKMSIVKNVKFHKGAMKYMFCLVQMKSRLFILFNSFIKKFDLLALSWQNQVTFNKEQKLELYQQKKKSLL